MEKTNYKEHLHRIYQELFPFQDPNKIAVDQAVFTINTLKELSKVTGSHDAYKIGFYDGKKERVDETTIGLFCTFEI